MSTAMHRKMRIVDMDIYNITKAIDETLTDLSRAKINMPVSAIEEKLADMEREDYKKRFLESNRCNFATCRHNKDGICQNEVDREDCVRICRLVLCMEDMEDEGEKRNI